MLPGFSRLPAGLRDLLPEEAESMRATQEAILAEMRRWGYRFVVTPTLEHLDVLARGLDAEQLRRLHKFTDTDGSLLAPVGERTVSVARLAAGPLRSHPLPLRLCYAGSVLTQASDRFRQRRETYQAGGELIGANGPAADAEVIALAARCLETAGLGEYHLDVGHSEFFQGVVEGLRAPAELKRGIRTALAARDLVALENLLDATPLKSAEHELLRRFPALRGGPEILEAASKLVSNGRAARALEELAQVRELLVAHGLGEVVRLDLGAIRDFDYYTGVTFEAYGSNLGRSLARGGRYDRLLNRFGRPAPATGLVVLLDLVAESMAGSSGPPRLPRLHAAVTWADRGHLPAVRLGASLRLFGMRAVVDTAPRSLPAGRRWRAQVGADHLLHCGGADDVTWISPGQRMRRLPPERVVASLKETGGGSSSPPPASPVSGEVGDR